MQTNSKYNNYATPYPTSKPCSSCFPKTPQSSPNHHPHPSTNDPDTSPHSLYLWTAISKREFYLWVRQSCDHSRPQFRWSSAPVVRNSFPHEPVSSYAMPDWRRNVRLGAAGMWVKTLRWNFVECVVLVFGAPHGTVLCNYSIKVK